MRAKVQEKAKARSLRKKGMPYKKIASSLGVSPGSVHLWCKDISLTQDQREKNKERKYELLRKPKTCSNCGEKFHQTVVVEGVRRSLSNREECLRCRPMALLSGEEKLTSSQRVSRSRRKRKKDAVAYMGGACRICGYDACIGVLHFHHVDPQEKDFNISRKNYQGWKKTREELKKCILVCANCHGEIHAGMVDISEIPPGPPNH